MYALLKAVARILSTEPLEQQGRFFFPTWFLIAGSLLTFFFGRHLGRAAAVLSDCGAGLIMIGFTLTLRFGLVCLLARNAKSRIAP
jgi:hypothetical protein